MTSQFNNHRTVEQLDTWVLDVLGETLHNMPFPRCLDANMPHKLPVFVDIGSNLGVVTQMAAPYYNKLYAFEPTTETYALSLIMMEQPRNGWTLPAAPDANTSFFNAAVGGSNQRFATIYGGVDCSGDVSMYPQEGESHAFKQRTLVISFDEIFELCEIEYIDYLKIDAEGAEYDILYDATKLSQVGAITGELHGPENQINELKEYLSKYFDIYTRADNMHIFFGANKQTSSVLDNYGFIHCESRPGIGSFPGSDGDGPLSLVLPPYATPEALEKLFNTQLKGYSVEEFEFKTSPQLGWKLFKK